MNNNGAVMEHAATRMVKSEEGDERTLVALDEVTIAFLQDVRTECEKKQREILSEMAVPFINQEQAALQLFIRRNKLEGSWRLTQDGNSLVKE